MRPLLVFFGCRIETVKHDPNEALSDANVFMKVLYVDENYQAAYELCHPEFRNYGTPDNLRDMVELIKQQYGGLKRIKVDSYLQVLGRSIELFYVGEYERGKVYHHLVLIGDATSGYKVSGVWFKPDPYPEQTLRHKFDEDIFVE